MLRKSRPSGVMEMRPFCTSNDRISGSLSNSIIEFSKVHINKKILWAALEVSFQA